MFLPCNSLAANTKLWPIHQLLTSYFHFAVIVFWSQSFPIFILLFVDIGFCRLGVTFYSLPLVPSVLPSIFMPTHVSPYIHIIIIIRLAIVMVFSFSLFTPFSYLGYLFCPKTLSTDFSLSHFSSCSFLVQVQRARSIWIINSKILFR